jgi:hypothetical protein
MKCIVVLTNRYYDNIIRPLRELGVTTFQAAEEFGLLTEEQAYFAQHKLGPYVPTEQEFENYQARKYAEIQEISF